MPGPITAIRCAEPAESAALRDLHRRSSFVWQDDRANLERHPEVFGVAPEAIAERRVRVAIGDGGEMVGFATTSDAGEGASELDDLFVDPAAMRRGIGRALVEDVAAIAWDAGFRRMTVVAHPRNFPFYESVAFLAGEVTATQFGPAVRMWRELDSPSR